MNDATGSHPDPAKAAVIQNMPRLINETRLSEFLGMVTDLTSFIPLLLTHTAWATECRCQLFMQRHLPGGCFQCMKELIYADVTLHYLWCQLTCDTIGWYLKAWLTGSTRAIGKTHGLHQQDTYVLGGTLCKHTGYVGLCLQSWAISYACVWASDYAGLITRYWNK